MQMKYLDLQIMHFFLCKGVQQVPGFCLPLHLLHYVFVVFNDFDVIWFCIFDGNKTKLNWTEGI